ncbi:hypothetical protein BSCH_00007c [Candidatus Paraburkholderia schumanniana]|nr:hypothetical protein BSCH_00007c [Candidatus Paraburkholderia schumannianae]
MERGRRGRGRGRGRARWVPMDHVLDRESEVEQEGQGQGQEAPPVDQVATAIQQMAALLAQMVGQQGQGQGNNNNNNNNNQEAGDRALERFQKFQPPKFHGGPNPDLAEGWLDRMGDIFATLRYTEERQIAFAVFQFEGAARAWWNVVRAKWEREQTPWTWANFTREFNQKFFPPIVQEQREAEFMRLRQGARAWPIMKLSSPNFPDLLRIW